MHCPTCRHLDARVIDTRVRDESVRRRRECNACSFRFTTLERVYNSKLMVAKRSGKHEEFSTEKLAKSIEIACAKRYLPVGAINQIVEEIHQQAMNDGRERIESGVIGQMVLNRLKSLDPVAYMRFASVYKDFDDLDRFTAEATSLEDTDSEDSRFQGTLIPNPASTSEIPTAQRNWAQRNWVQRN